MKIVRASLPQLNGDGKNMIPLFKPFIPDLPMLEKILRSGQLAYGDYTKQFEDSLKLYFDIENVMVVSSYGLAISIAAKTLALKANDEIIMSPMACLVSTQPYASMEFNIKWCDVERDRGTISPASLREKISPNTKLIVHNHFCGYPGRIDEVNQIASEFGIPVIDDGIEAFGSLYKGKKIGNCGSDITVFSLSAVRPLSTIEGGILIFKSKELFKKALLIRDCGIDRKKFRDSMGEINPHCNIKEVGYSAMMSDINGYIGLEQIKYVDHLIYKQRQNAKEWEQLLKNANYCESIVSEDTLPNYWIYGILSDEKEKTIRRFRENGYYASGVHINNAVYSVFGNCDNQLPGAEEFNSRFVALPCGWWME